MTPKKKKTSLSSESENPPRDTNLKSELESRFLSYALSTIVSRALPDVRDGLKPVHRRILYSMNQLRLFHNSRYRKSAAVVGDVIGKYHPHGDQAVYDTMVRLAQEFSLRYPLIDGQGNFGNVDGDPAAAMRYTEARLDKLSGELLSELNKETVDMVPTYDETSKEPALVPARFPNLLVNGSSGIAVGLATNIPPHNIMETIDALAALIDKPKLETKDILKYIKGPDFPTGAIALSSKKELMQIYESGRGSIKVRGEWETENIGRGKWQIIVTSVPYSVNKSALIEKIGDLIINKSLTSLVDVRDESTEEIRIVLEPRSQTIEAEKVMTYLFKHTDLQSNFAVNLTALTPDLRPHRHSLKEMLKSFLDFRYITVGKRLTYDLRIIEERLHILSALAKIYRYLDEAIAIIRKSKTRDEARKGLMKRFKFDEIQANAILDLRLAALVGLEISKIKQEKAEKDAEREIIKAVLGNSRKLWTLVKKELKEIRDEYGDKRRTKIVASISSEPEYSAEDFIEHESTHVIVSRDGWVRRVKNVTRPESLRFKGGDAMLAWLPMTTRDLVCFFSSAGKMYCIRALDITQTTGFGDPVQSIFKFSDKERIVAVLGLIRDGGGGKQAANDPDARSQRVMFDQLNENSVGRIYGEILDFASLKKEPELLTVTESGMGFRFSSSTLSETNKNGKKFASLKGDDSILGVVIVRGGLLFTLSSDGRGLLCKMDEVPLLGGPGAGVRLMKLKQDAVILGYRTVSPKDKLTLTYLAGKDDVIKIVNLEKGARGTVGRVVGGRRKKLAGMLRV